MGTASSWPGLLSICLQGTAACVRQTRCYRTARVQGCEAAEKAALVAEVTALRDEAWRLDLFAQLEQMKSEVAKLADEQEAEHQLLTNGERQASQILDSCPQEESGVGEAQQASEAVLEEGAEADGAAEDKLMAMLNEQGDEAAAELAEMMLKVEVRLPVD